jgi:hypothetical protein
MESSTSIRFARKVASASHNKPCNVFLKNRINALMIHYLWHVEFLGIAAAAAEAAAAG